MYKHKFSLVACSRWEEDYIVEWVEYHRSLGFDHIYVYSNDDEPYTQYARLQPYLLRQEPYVTYLFWPIVGQQLSMYMHFLKSYKQETEWACFLDIDEFLVLKNCNNISMFMQEFEPICDCVYFNWVNFGNSGKTVRDNRGTLLELTKRSAGVDVHTKTIFRSRSVTPEGAQAGLSSTNLPYTHFWNNYPFDGFRLRNVLHDDVSWYTDEFPNKAFEYVSNKEVSQKILARAYIAHFLFKSEDDFVRRARRGGFPDQQKWLEKYQSGEYAFILAGLNQVEDLYLKEYWRERTKKAIVEIEL